MERVLKVSMLHRLLNLEMSRFWNFTTARRQLLKIWRCQFYRIFQKHILNDAPYEPFVSRW